MRMTIFVAEDKGKPRKGNIRGGGEAYDHSSD
jgi:hypothetical protein